jgi:rhodanese-related sulfurtransferase
MKYAVLFFAVAISFSFFGQKTPPKVLKTVGVTEVKEELKKHEFVILDVRTPEEYNAGHLKGAINLNYYDADFQKKLAAMDKRKKVVVYCAVGGRSGKALSQMDALGFQYVLNMKGGYNAWSAQQ